MEIFVRHDAELDAFGYFEYLHERNPDAAIDKTMEGLAKQPMKGRLRRFRGRGLRDIRSWRVNDFENYLIFYRATGERIEILRIKHGTMGFPRALAFQGVEAGCVRAVLSPANPSVFIGLHPWLSIRVSSCSFVVPALKKALRKKLNHDARQFLVNR